MVAQRKGGGVKVTCEWLGLSRPLGRTRQKATWVVFGPLFYTLVCCFSGNSKAWHELPGRAHWCIQKFVVWGGTSALGWWLAAASDSPKAFEKGVGLCMSGLWVVSWCIGVGSQGRGIPGGE